jgi:SAM-dependent methyltransferase
VIARAATSLRLRAADAADAMRGRRDPLVPPRRLSGYVGDSDFRATGEEFLGHFRQLAGLSPGDRVLELGCGIGRMARVLVPVLRPPGSYDGFDVVAAGIDWCRERYLATPAPFRFRHADLRNGAYNRAAAGSAADFRFPYDDARFDLVIATSLFTHLLPDEAANYLSESARVLAPGGRMLSTWMVLVGAEQDAPPAGLERSGGLPGAVADPAAPEAMIAYDERWLRARAGAAGLRIRSLSPGSWRGRPGPSRQDIVVADRA